MSARILSELAADEHAHATAPADETASQRLAAELARAHYGPIEINPAHGPLPYAYDAHTSLTREQCKVLSLRFAPDWTLEQIKHAAQSIGGKLVNDRHGNIVIVRATA